MKKILACFVIFTALIFIVSCGGCSKTSDNSDTGDTVTDKDTVDTDSVSDTEPSGGGTEPSDNPDPDNPDPDNPDPDNPDSDNPDSDNPDSDDSDTANEIPVNLPECNPTSETPCYDSSSELIWSKKAEESMEHYDAELYCESYSEAGLSGWHLPTIDELKTLLIWSKADSCKVSEENGCCHYRCWSCGSCTEEENNCSYAGTLYDDGRFSKFGDVGFFWSSSSVWPSSIVRSESEDDDDDFEYCEFCEDAWGVDFDGGGVFHVYMHFNKSVRCVRNAD